MVISCFCYNKSKFFIHPFGWTNNHNLCSWTFGSKEWYQMQ